MTERWSQRNVYATVVIGLLGVATSLGVFLLDSNGEDLGKETELSSIGDSDEAPDAPRISITSIHISDAAMDVPAVFEVSIEAGGLGDQPVSGTDVVFDFGRAEVETCGYTPTRSVQAFISSDINSRKLTIDTLQAGENLNFICLLNAPFFDQVFVQVGNIFSGRSITFAEYQESLVSDRPSFWAILGYIFVSILFIINCLPKIIGLSFSNQ